MQRRGVFFYLRRVKLLLTLLLFYALPAVAQQQCNCTTELGSYLNCDTIQLQNGAKLYYQCNPKMYWLTLQQKLGKKKVLFRETEPEAFHIAGRLRYRLLREYRSTLLFTYGCPATGGGCQFVVIDKSNGKLLVETAYPNILEQQGLEAHDFLLYYTDKNPNLQLFYLHTRKQYALPEKVLCLPKWPDFHFKAIQSVGNKIQLVYEGPDGKDLVRTIDRQRYPE